MTKLSIVQAAKGRYGLHSLKSDSSDSNKRINKTIYSLNGGKHIPTSNNTHGVKLETPRKVQYIRTKFILQSVFLLPPKSTKMRLSVWLYPELTGSLRSVR